MTDAPKPTGPLQDQVEHRVQVNDAEVTVRPLSTVCFDVAENSAQCRFAEWMKHKKNRCVIILEVRCVHTHEFDVVVGEPALEMILPGLDTKALNDLDADGTPRPHPACCKHSSSHPAAEVGEHIVVAQINHSQKSKKVAIRGGVVVDLPIIVARLTRRGMKAERSDAQPPIPEFVVWVQ
jgi:hypothetical protein